MALVLNRTGSPVLFRDDFFDGDDFFAPSFFNFDGDLSNFRLAKQIPSANITENPKDFVIELAAPGLEKKDFKVEADKDILTISAEKKTEEKKETKNYSRKRFSYNSFSRSFNLPDNTLPDKIAAEYQNGVLKLTLPKKEVTVVSPKKEIKVA